jgi:hypothetical protein
MFSKRNPLVRRATLLFLSVALLVFAVVDSAAATPFSSTSPLNRRIPSSPAIDARSNAMVRALLSAASGSGFRVSIKRYSAPIYTARSSTRRVRVRLTASWAPRHFMYGVPILRRAAPDSGSDGHLAIVDHERGCEYDFWQAKKTTKGWTASWGNRLKLGSTGIFRYGLSARASGFALRAGIITPSELRRRKISHALVFAFPTTMSGGPVRPASQSDGSSRSSGAIPMGARVQLAPSFRLGSIKMKPWQRTIARALQRYGMFLADTGPTLALRAQNPQSFAKNPYPRALRGKISVTLPRALVRHMRVLKLPDQYSPPKRIQSLNCGTMR